MSKPQFYEDLAARSAGEGSVFDAGALVRVGAVRQWGEARRGGPARIADIGCGAGVFLRDFALLARDRFSVACECHGCDLAPNPKPVFDQVPGGVRFQSADIDGKPLPYESGAFDLVACNHVIEHIFETEHLVSELRRILKPGGICVLSTPNLSCWPNRIALLLGLQPLSVEVGTRHMHYGWPVFRERMRAWQPPGHIRCFTRAALEDMAREAGFAVAGVWRQERKWMYRNVALVLTA